MATFQHIFFMAIVRMNNNSKVVLAKYGSDHFALLTELVYNPDSDNQKQQEQIDKEKAVDELKMPTVSKQQVPMFEE